MAAPSPSSSGNKMLKFGIFLALILMLLHVALEFNQTLGRVVATDEEKSGDAVVVVADSEVVKGELTSLAYRDSLGFFVDIPDGLWKERRRIARARSMYAKPSNPLESRHQAHAFYQMNHEPMLSCLNENMLGNMGDGHKWICDPVRIEQQSKERIQKGDPGCLVYSIGSNGLFDFEEAVQQYMPSCEIHTFDFTDYSHKIPPNLSISYHVWGLKPSYEEDIAKVGGISPGFAEQLWKRGRGTFKTIQETLKELGHEKRTIDIFKIDCEGCEWFSYKDWISNDIRQIQVEVHEAPLLVNEFFEGLHDAGFAMFHKEPNIQWTGGKCVEFAFLKMAPSFLNDAIP